jgi:hypothetical protein
VTVVTAPQSASGAAFAKPPTFTPPAPLDATILAAAKSAAAARFKKSVNPSPRGLTGPLTLGPATWTAKVGSASGALTLLDVGVINSQAASFNFGGQSNTAGIGLDYDGLTAGSLYLLDCSTIIFGSQTGSQIDVFYESDLKPTATLSPVKGHILFSLQADRSHINVRLSNKDQTKNGGAWGFTGCTLHPVE